MPPLLEFEHQKLVFKFKVQLLPPLFPLMMASHVPAFALMLEKETFVAPVNWTANEDNVPDAVAFLVSTVMVTSHPPDPSEPPDVKVYVTPPALVVSAFATQAKLIHTRASSAPNTRTFFMKLPPGCCTHLMRGPVNQPVLMQVLYQRTGMSAMSPLEAVY